MNNWAQYSTRPDNQLSLKYVSHGFRPFSILSRRYQPWFVCFLPESRTPIIIIPAGATSLITLYNAQDLLQDYKWVLFFVLLLIKAQIGCGTNSVIESKAQSILIQRTCKLFLMCCESSHFGEARTWNVGENLKRITCHNINFYWISWIMYDSNVTGVLTDAGETLYLSKEGLRLENLTIDCVTQAIPQPR